MDADGCAPTAASPGFPGHDREGAELARAVLRRLRASAKLADHVAALCLHHLRLGFLVHERPLDRRAVWRYLQATEPWSPEVTVFTVADRLATRGRNAERGDRRPRRARARAARAGARAARGGPAARRSCAATSWRASSASRRGPRLGELLAQLEEDRYAGAIATRDDAITRARELARRLSERTASRQTAVVAATVPRSRFAATSRCEW